MSLISRLAIKSGITGQDINCPIAAAKRASSIAAASWEGFLAKWNEHLSQCLSPLRTADIRDMIVEVDSRYLADCFYKLKAYPQRFNAGTNTV